MSSPPEDDELLVVILPDGVELRGNPTRDAPRKRGRRRGEDARLAAAGNAGRKPRGTPRKKARRRLAYLVGTSAVVVALAAFVTTAVVVTRGGFLVAWYPAPGELASPHAQVTETSGSGRCGSCHHRAGITKGCLTCHEEIADQISGGAGFHHFLADGGNIECDSCHLEHRGREYRLVSDRSWNGHDPERFQHPHVAFSLEGRHGTIECEECHEKKLQTRFTLPRFPGHPRRRTFLGLEQECTFCHEDIHSSGLSEDCESCHGQDAFRPAAKFDHSVHFPLDGGHDRVPCDRCHEIPEVAPEHADRLLPFDKVRGTLCDECHESPHRASFAASCDVCHAAPQATWSDGRHPMTPDLHAVTGFRLVPPHDDVACEKCHSPELAYEEKYPDSSAADYSRTEDTCQGCHRDVHGGQFEGNHRKCLDCHDRLQFTPHRYGRERHARVYPLTDAHAEADCESCHVLDPATHGRRFTGTSRECESCHHDPHDGQFARKYKRCENCHDTRRFLPANLGHVQHERFFPLTGSHGAVPCTSCHALDPKTRVRRFVSISKECKDCHENPHGDQFDNEILESDCIACHSQAADTFTIRDFEHEKLTGYALNGAHAEAKCEQCHVETAIPGAAPSPVSVRVYRGTGRECSSCHSDAHRGQFHRDPERTCGDCHASTTTWSDTKFDHDRQSRFALDGSHATVECEGCHFAVELPDGSEIIQYKPLGTECKDCHEIVPR